jgi:tetratricopeptide (TPR) repeat protein
MKKSRSNKISADPSGGGGSYNSSNPEFYSSSPTEKPLVDTTGASDSKHVRRTGRHQATASGRKKEARDPREVGAQMAILKSITVVILLMITFLVLYKGIKLFEESVWMDHALAEEGSPVLQEVVLVEDFDIQAEGAREQFAERIATWKEADRLVRSADALIQRSIYDQAIERCQDALRLDSAHMGALARLGQLYHAKENYVEAANAYIRLLSIDPSQDDVQKKLIHTLDALGDSEAVMYMAEWYLEQNTYDVDVQRYLANARYVAEEFAIAAEEYSRVLQDLPKDQPALEKQASSYMLLKQYDKALPVWEQLRGINYRTQNYYKQISICNAQLLQTKETVQTLSHASQLFGEKLLINWVVDPLYDPVREERAFLAFTERIGDKKFREWNEQMAQNLEDRGKVKTEVQLEMPKAEPITEDQLKPQQ